MLTAARLKGHVVLWYSQKHAAAISPTPTASHTTPAAKMSQYRRTDGLQLSRILFIHTAIKGSFHPHSEQTSRNILVRKALSRGGDAAAKGNEFTGTVHSPYRYDCRLSEQTAELSFVSGFFPRDRDQPRGRSLPVYYPYRHLIGYYRGKGFGRSISRKGDHVQPDRAYAGHRFEFFNGKKSLRAAWAILRSSLTGIKAPLRPPT